MSEYTLKEIALSIEKASEWNRIVGLNREGEMNTDAEGEDTPDPEIGIWGWESSQPVGDFGQSKLSPACVSILSDFFEQLEKDHVVNNGTTALWVHVVSIIGSSIDR